jgi:hypothetical protein
VLFGFGIDILHELLSDEIRVRRRVQESRSIHHLTPIKRGTPPMDAPHEGGLKRVGAGFLKENQANSEGG